MPIPRFVRLLPLWLSLLSVLFLSACTTYTGQDFTFTAPSGFTTTTYEKPYTEKTYNAEYLLFSQQGSLYFQILRQKIPSGGSLDSLFTAYLAKTKGVRSHYQFISQNTLQVKNRPAIEYVHREFSGEPYVQVRELWLEYNGSAYTLVCSEAVDSTPGKGIPVADVCFQLAQSVQFKQP